MFSAPDERSLSEIDLDPEPSRQFNRWFAEAIALGERMPGAMALATVGTDGLPRVRMMQLEDVDERGFTFQTNLDGPKAGELAALPHAALAFFWPSLLRQVRVTGAVSLLSRDEVAAYFDRAPSGIQTMIRACRQSDVIPDRAALLQVFNASLASGDTTLPPHWGGYRVAPQTIEFWQGRPNWLQDRLRYTRQSVGGWTIERLVP
jgi:pyridoxamine 5'-phosphate oxidase